MVSTRKRWLSLMLEIADPVLGNLAEGKLHDALPIDVPDRALYAHLEAFGRTLTGMAPWLEHAPQSGEEGVLAAKYRAVARKCMDSATDPRSPDCMNFTEGYGQSLVDAAFLAHAIVRAPRELYEKLEPRVKRNLAAALVSTRKFEPYPTNWLFFSAMIETALYVMGEKYDIAPVDRAVDKFREWYVGDGTYGDGEFFHFDYYNSFVIHPMYVDIVRKFAPVKPEYAQYLDTVIARAARYAETLERMIAPDGTYPVVGRSVCYRFGAFHALAQAAYEGYLPPRLSYAQVRCALDAVIKRTVSEDVFDDKKFLRRGVAGYQPSLAEGYICVGSLYLCESVFLPLGLPETHAFWADADCKYTSQKIWSGQDLPADKAED